MNLRSRLSVLEATNSSRLAVVAWWRKTNGRAATKVGGSELEQGASEGVSEFLGRATSLLRDQRIVWVDELDQRL